jgi:ketopantoate reductase
MTSRLQQLVKMISQPTKSNVLLVGSGGVGTMGAYALETGGKAEVTAVLRSNYEVVTKQGFFIDSIEHGNGIEGWKPTKRESCIIGRRGRKLQN